MVHTNIEKEILQLLREADDEPLLLREIAGILKIKSSSAQFAELEKTLKELLKQNVIIQSSKRRYSLVAEEETAFKGVMRIKNERGFVETSHPTFKKISVKTKNMLTAFDGDIVLVKLFPSKKGKKFTGEVVRIINRREHLISGTIEYDGNFYFLNPDDTKYYIDFLIHPKNLNGAKDGDKVSAKMLSWEDNYKSPQAEVLKTKSRSKESEQDNDTIVEELYLPRSFVKDVIEEAEKISAKLSKKDIEARLDLRNEEIITIDPADAKDFDDALSLKILPNGNYYLGVHIADVSYYVKENSAIDEEAKYRGNSIYLVGKVIPMLPENLSNEICSLQPKRIRLCFSVFMEFSQAGILKKYEIAETVIKSKRRFAYEEVQKIIEDGKGELSGLILKLNQLAKTLKTKRFEKGGINFESMEVNFILDENNYPTNAIVKKSTNATNLVEECMLAANQVVAGHMREISKKMKLKNILPFIYRVHDEPPQENLKTVLSFIKTLNPNVSIHGNSSKEINLLLEKFKHLPEKPIVHQLLLRAMAKAEYAVENIGHYGLAFKEYTHFTSPIRRYPDLIVHRLIKKYSKDKINFKNLPGMAEELTEITEHCTIRERLAMEAERASVKLYQTILASDYLGKEFIGTISGVMNFGIFILLDEIFAEGLLNFRDMSDDYYYLDEKNHRVIGKRKGREFSFGKRMKVKIIRVNIEKKRIDLSLLK